ncbi:MAG: hypothetical protein N3A58_02110 [Spirochaetes bacterium]|nr:hypothetical protein [Spirochaetota bacterium]
MKKEIKKILKYLFYIPLSKSVLIRKIILIILLNPNNKFSFLYKNKKCFGDDIKSILNLFYKLGLTNNFFVYIRLFLSKSIKINIKESGFIARFSILFVPFYFKHLNNFKLKKISILPSKTLRNRRLQIEREIEIFLSHFFYDIEIRYLKNNDYLPVQFTLINNIINKENFNKEQSIIQKCENNFIFDKIKNCLTIKFNISKTSQSLSSLLIIIPLILIYNSKTNSKISSLNSIKLIITNIKSFSFIIMTLYILLKNGIIIYIESEKNKYKKLTNKILNNLFKSLILEYFEINKKKDKPSKLDNFNLNLIFKKIKIYDNNYKEYNLIKLKNDFKYILENFEENILNENYIKELDLSILSFFYILFYLYPNNLFLKIFFNKKLKRFLKKPQKINYFCYQGDFLFFIFFDILNKSKKNTFYFNFENSPDIIFPSILFTIIKKKKVFFYGIERLIYKESNRITSIQNEFHKLNINIFYNKKENYLYIDGKEAYEKLINFQKTIKKKVLINSYNDHRIVFLFSILCSIFGLKIKIKGKSSISKTFPNFFNLLKKIYCYNNKN